MSLRIGLLSNIVEKIDQKLFCGLIASDTGVLLQLMFYFWSVFIMWFQKWRPSSAQSSPSRRQTCFKQAWTGRAITQASIFAFILRPVRYVGGKRRVGGRQMTHGPVSTVKDVAPVQWKKSPRPFLCPSTPFNSVYSKALAFNTPRLQIIVHAPMNQNLSRRNLTSNPLKKLLPWWSLCMKAAKRASCSWWMLISHCLSYNPDGRQEFLFHLSVSNLSGERNNRLWKSAWNAFRTSASNTFFFFLHCNLSVQDSYMVVSKATSRDTDGASQTGVEQVLWIALRFASDCRPLHLLFSAKWSRWECSTMPAVKGKD